MSYLYVIYTSNIHKGNAFICICMYIVSSGWKREDIGWSFVWWVYIKMCGRKVFGDNVILFYARTKTTGPGCDRETASSASVAHHNGYKDNLLYLCHHGYRDSAKSRIHIYTVYGVCSDKKFLTWFLYKFELGIVCMNVFISMYI